MNPERLAALQAAKLRALVGSIDSSPPCEERAFGPGAALVQAPTSGERAPTGWVYPLATTLRSLGEAMVWAASSGIDHLNLVVDDTPDGVSRDLARRAAAFRPGPTVWTATESEGRGRIEQARARALPERSPAPAAPELVDLLLDTGVEVVQEDGIVRGEVNGLEVARIVHDVTSTGVPIDAPALEVGVGGADRELTGQFHGDRTVADQLARVVQIVRTHRAPDSPSHPLNRLAPERWLRALAVRSPGSLGLEDVRPVEAWPPRRDLNQRAVAMAAGRTPEGAPVVLAFSVGFDADLLPTAGDVRHAVDPGVGVWFVLPERDVHPLVPRMAGHLPDPVRVIPVSGDWRHGLRPVPAS